MRHGRTTGFFQCEVNGKPASAYLDMGLKRSMPDKRRHALRAVAIDLLHPHPANGLRAADARPFGLVYEIAQSASLAVITQTTGLLTQLSEKKRRPV